MSEKQAKGIRFSVFRNKRSDSKTIGKDSDGNIELKETKHNINGTLYLVETPSLKEIAT